MEYPLIKHGQLEINHVWMMFPSELHLWENLTLPPLISRRYTGIIHPSIHLCADPAYTLQQAQHWGLVTQWFFLTDNLGLVPQIMNSCEQANTKLVISGDLSLLSPYETSVLPIPHLLQSPSSEAQWPH